MQIFARSVPLWGLTVITRSNFGSLIQQNIAFSPHEGMDPAKENRTNSIFKIELFVWT